MLLCKNSPFYHHEDVFYSWRYGSYGLYHGGSMSLNALIFTGETDCAIVPLAQIPGELITVDKQRGIWNAPVGGDNHLGEFRIGHDVRVPSYVDSKSGVAFVYDSDDMSQVREMTHVAEEIRTGQLSH
ncbi:MAG: hypothetical protein WC757_01725 [Candidatus Paceibacterota bacterium]|jgi:hypothetical protein